MQLFPAIDLRKGQCVRLVQGDFQQETVVAQDPVAQAQAFEQAGARFLHIVDLDGAKAGKAVNRELIAAMKRATSLFIEVGGGIRTLTQIEDYLSLGIDRIIIGSAALTDPDLVASAVALYGEKIAVGIDAKNEFVAISGWLDVQKTDFLTLAVKMNQLGVKTFIYTDILRDGTMTGPNFDHYTRLKAAVQGTVIASGGIKERSDLERLKELGIDGAIIGKALYENKITMPELVEVSQC